MKNQSFVLSTLTKPSFKKNIIIYNISLLIIIFFILYIYIRTNNEYEKSSQWVEHTQAVLNVSDSILFYGQDVVMSTRGYIITGDENFLKPFIDNNTFEILIAKLKMLVNDNPNQASRIDSLSNLYNEYLLLRSRSIQVRRSTDFKLEQENDLIHGSDLIIKRMRSVFTSIKKEELQLLYAQKKILSGHIRDSLAIIKTLILLFVLFLILFSVIIYKNIVRRNNAERKLQDLNDDLENQVKQKTKNVIEQKEKYRFLLQNMQEGIQVISYDWRYLFVNNSVVQQGKYQSKELLGHTMMEIYPGIENTEMFKVLRQCMDGRLSKVFENEFTYPDGSKGWFQLSIQPVPEGLFILSMDISERKKAENTVKDSEEKRRLIMNAALDAIVCMDTNGRITFWNPQAEKVFGWKNEEVISKLLSDFIIPEEYRQRHSAGLKNYLQTNEGPLLNKIVEINAINKKQDNFPVEISILPIKQVEEQFFCAFIRDITERKQSEILMKSLNSQLERRATELQASNTELQHFAYVASHDLQEPLRMVTSFLALLEKRINDQLDDSSKSYMKYAVDGADRMKQLIQDLLRYSRVEAINENMRQVNLEEIVEASLNVYLPIIQETNAKIIVSAFPTITGNKMQLNQLFQNLIGNSLKYRNEHSPLIELGYKELDDHWVFYIKDNGIGIDPKYFDKIFIIFQRLHNRSEYNGTGIGLAICKKIVERHGGKIWVESNGKTGSTFYFTLKKL